ncbi:hypothetical protein FRB99_008510 [Tulasnella sp. 403]|nr:hypothetical protein FRB99_008510 [Tulasnella sp. 403]
MTGSVDDNLPAKSFTFTSVATAGSPLSRLLHLGHVELHYILCICVLVGAILVLAYLTNPSEASFRAFVTELAFRHHLTKLSNSQEGGVFTSNGANASPGPRHSSTSLSSSSPLSPAGPGFHFSNRANISLRTPAHRIRSFAFFTIVIITPVASPLAHDKYARATAVLEGTWYFGALGHWWIGGMIDLPLSRHQVQREYLGKEEGSSVERGAGVIHMKCLDVPTTAPLAAIPVMKTSPLRPTKVKRRRSVARKSQGNTNDENIVVPRSITPPPLPKSASLPLHSTRMPSINPPSIHISHGDRGRYTQPKGTGNALPASTACPDSSASLRSPSQAIPRPQSSNSPSVDQNPAVADVLKELRAAQGAVSQLQSQLSTYTSASAVQQESLQATLNDQRERKLQDDHSRNEVRLRLKELEDARLAADLAKKAVEGRLKAVQEQHDSALNRIQRLEVEIQEMQKTMADDEGRVVKSGIEASAHETEMGKKMQAKRKELDLTEVASEALAARVKELEERIKVEATRLSKAKADAEERHKQRLASMQQQQQRGNLPSGNHHRQPPVTKPNVVPHGQPQHPHPGMPPNDLIPMPVNLVRAPTAFNFMPPNAVVSARQAPPGLLQRRNIPATAEPEPLLIPGVGNPQHPVSVNNSSTGSLNNSSRPRAMSLAGNNAVTLETSGAPVFTAIAPPPKGGASSTNTFVSSTRDGLTARPAPEKNPLSFFGRRKPSQSRQITKFSPFSDSDALEPTDSRRSSQDDAQSMSTFATSLLPSSLYKSLDAESNPSPDLSNSSQSFPTFDYATDVYGSGPELSDLRSDHSWPISDTQSFSSDGHGSTFRFSPFSPDLSISSPVIGSSLPLFNQNGPYGAIPQQAGPFGSAASASQLSFEQYASAPAPMEALEGDKTGKHRRWFPSFINSQAAQIAAFPPRSSDPNFTKGKSKNGLNPDAKVFSFTRNQSNILNGQANDGGNGPSPAQSSQSPPQMHTPHASLASRMYGSLTHGLHYHRHSSSQSQQHDELPAPTTPTGNFFSSLLAFAPSPAERQALQRGLEKTGNGATVNGNNNTSREYLPNTAVSPFTSPLPSAQSSAVNLPPTAASAPWDRDPPKSTSPVEKRSFSSLWLRNKAARSSNASLNEEGGDEASQGFGNRWFTRQKGPSDSEGVNQK